jgi:hypothetical protein
MRYSPARLLAIVAVVLFVLAAFGATLGSLGELDLIALGLACLAGVFVLGRP